MLLFGNQRSILTELSHHEATVSALGKLQTAPSAALAVISTIYLVTVTQSTSDNYLSNNFL